MGLTASVEEFTEDGQRSQLHPSIAMEREIFDKPIKHFVALVACKAVQVLVAGSHARQQCRVA